MQSPAPGVRPAATPSAAPGQPSQPSQPGQPSQPEDRKALTPRHPYADLLAQVVSGANVMVHLKKLEEFAKTGGGSRAAGTAGYEKSVRYVADRLRAGGYRVTVQDFEYPKSFKVLKPPVVQRLGAKARQFRAGEDFRTTYHSGSGDVTARVRPVDVRIPPGKTPNSSTSGCEADDFDDFTPGDIALLQRGRCAMRTKARNAKAAGAAGLIIFNEGQKDRTKTARVDIGDWTLGLPAVFTSYAMGADLARKPGRVRLATSTSVKTARTKNVIAESVYGREDQVVMLGAHLDSVPEGAGINDNGSGSAALLEVAMRMNAADSPNRMRFAWWGAEEAGLHGSLHYVDSLGEADRERIAVYLNFDMVASPNYAYKVFDGDDSDKVGGVAGPPGSDQIERDFRAFYTRRKLTSVSTDFDGRSDYAAFVVAGIPAGGIFTGAEGKKSKAEAERFGGEAGKPYDPCYHAACDNASNINATALDVNADAIATLAATYAFAPDLPGPDAPERSARTAGPPPWDASARTVPARFPPAF
ncbi:M20/M25/M40 family metallo-hydrolase [Bailinhaonella thermotolerans]|uniref:M20/M25/M40 family metallo-hydrolase n=1 Tax=Bailinhaonella thermotolerans TaxID=1070861 RepID=A0A3A4AE78_9ACTN|nr:M20/M25/M40 family metallo-hydrolase [Bailinhaonella thermotolerans]